MVDYEQFANSCLNEAPHPDNFSHVLRSAALDAALAVGNMMAYIHDNNDDVIIDTARLALDTVSLYIAVTDSTPPFDVGSKHRLEHSLTQRELQRQAEDINFLMSLPDIMQPEVVSQVRKRAEDAYDMIILK